MRRSFACCALAAMLLCAGAPASAYSEAEFCDSLDALLDAAPDRFRGIRSTTASQYVDGVPHFLALRVLPDTRQCVISVGDDPTLTCEYYTGIMPRAEELYARLIGEVRRCLRKRVEGPVVPSAESSTLTEYVTDDRTAVTIDNGDLFGQVVKLRLRVVDRP